jgi:hypothetical protein
MTGQTVYVANYRGGQSRTVIHLEENCSRLESSQGDPTPKERSLFPDDVDVCSLCSDEYDHRAVASENAGKSRDYNTLVEEADPEDLGLSPLDDQGDVDGGAP